MGIVFGVHDPDGERRRQVAEKIPASLFASPNRSWRSVTMAGFDLHWDAPASTPVSTATDRVGARNRIALVIGDYAAPYRLPSDAAQRLLQLTAGASDPACISGQDGYYLALLCDDTPRLVAGTDALGLFPFYYWTRGDVCLFGTSPDLFRLHPLFVASPSLHAIASVLLINHITAGRALFEGVRRPDSGKYLSWTSSEGSREVTANALAMSDAQFGASFESNRETVAACLDRYHKAIAGVRNVDLYLSGGQDSRAVAGYLHKDLPRGAVRAVSLGIRSDQELTYARKVSRALGFEHRFEDVEYESYPRFAASQIRTESLQGPFASFDIFTARRLLAERGCPFASGYMGDHVIGDGQVANAISPQTGEVDYDTLLKTYCGYGFEVADVQALLVDHGREGMLAIEQVLDGLRADWDAISGERFQKAWLFANTHRMRYHAGSIVWRLSLGAWHLLPYYTRPLLDAMTAMPLNHLHRRRIQADIIKRDFPMLATLPLDRNAVGPDYLVTPLWRKFVPPLSEVSWKLYRALSRNMERRYFHRVYDFNGPGWRSVRREVEPYRKRASALLNANALDRLLPAPDASPAFANAVRDASKTKTLLGLVMWYSAL